ncbi:hypothetical protein [Pallidibacillus pasinlerensis]|uniref:Uncharacterized protein n=1 Tax=Pallidibacillus pasinlerensis TaxID=2703818 RepID=A0ABX0A4J7_9BACI|nr:hypothetical protein [Pallidibacillus pasinlerensis]NCU18342.1 hypothetical protein [Pallidibacillus pasinlerensis]
MNPIIEKCMLTDEQRYIILQGIKEGKQKYEELTALLPDTITKKHTPFLQSDLVNTYIAKQIMENPHTQMKVYTQRAGSHPYIVVQDTTRNIFVLVSKLSKTKYMPNPSDYRGDFSLSNVERLLEMGASIEEIYGEKIPYQEFLPLGIENQPFGIIICYDGKSDTVFEGALRPDQEDWIYKENITEYLNINTKTIVPLDNYQLSDIQTSLKKSTEDDIVLKLKEKTTS